MRIFCLLFVRIFCLLFLSLWPMIATAAPSPSPTPSPTPWSWFRTPTKTPAKSIGGYSAGCIAGAVGLPLTGEGFHIARPERNRRFGHPALIGMIRELGHKLNQLHLTPLSVGDLGQPRGGPAPTGHASHQTGLDVDLWFLPPSGGRALSMVDPTGKRPASRFGARAIRLLELASLDERVEQIFVHPALKRAICQRVTRRAWLRKLRPWWGHDDHFHVRLACPADSPECVAQPALPPGDGCDQLGWWFDAKAQADRERGHQSYSSKVGAAPVLPERCTELLAPPR